MKDATFYLCYYPFKLYMGEQSGGDCYLRLFKLEENREVPNA